MSRPAIATLLLFLVAGAWFGSVEMARRKQQVTPEHAAADQRLAEAIAEIQARSVQDFQSGKLSAQAEQMQQMQAALEEASKAYEGQERKTTATLSRLFKEMAERMAALAKAQNNIEELFDFASLKERATLAQRQQQAEAIVRENEELVRYMERIGERLRTLLKEEAVDLATIDKAVTLTNESMADTLPLQLRIRRSDSDVTKALIEKFKLLDKEWGRWSVSGNNTVKFQSEESGRIYEQLNEVTKRALAMQEAAQQDLVETVKRR